MDEIKSRDSEMAATIEAVRRAYEPRTIEVSDGDVSAQVLLTPGANGGMAVTAIGPICEPLRERPRRRSGIITTDDAKSFVALVNRDKRDVSVVFAKRAKIGERPGPSLTAVLDYHDPSDDGEAGSPAFCKDRIAYTLPLSDEWETWTGSNGEAHAMDQGAFAQFIEDNLFDIGEPEAAGPVAQAFAAKMSVHFAGPSAMMAVSRGLEVRVNSRMSQAVTLADGTVQFQYAEEHTDARGAPLSVPRAFHVTIPIFRGGALYSIPVRLRYRTGGGRVSWFYEMHRADLFFDDAIGDVLALVAKVSPEGCGLPVILGSCPG